MKKYNADYQKEYRNRPENKEKAKEYQKKYREENEAKSVPIEKLRQYNLKYYHKKTKHYFRDYNRQYYKNNAEKFRERNLRRQYRITSEEYDHMLYKQNGVCAICNRTNEGDKKLSIDHCHATGKIRKLLCSRCNVGLGYFNDDTLLMQKAIVYIESNKYNQIQK